MKGIDVGAVTNLEFRSLWHVARTHAPVGALMDASLSNKTNLDFVSPWHVAHTHAPVGSLMDATLLERWTSLVCTKEIHCLSCVLKFGHLRRKRVLGLSFEVSI